MGKLENYLFVKEQCGALASLFYCGIHVGRGKLLPDRNPFLSVPLAQRRVCFLLSRFLPPAANSAPVAGGFFLFNHSALYGKVFSG
jgi:hypothetical protein